MELLYDNDYDEFSPISQELEEKLHEIDGIDWENSNLIEGAYVTCTVSQLNPSTILPSVRFESPSS